MEKLQKTIENQRFVNLRISIFSQIPTIGGYRGIGLALCGWLTIGDRGIEVWHVQKPTPPPLLNEIAI